MDYRCGADRTIDELAAALWDKCGGGPRLGG
jgi:hypothetical protein